MPCESTVKYNYAWYNYLGVCAVKFTSRFSFCRIVEAVLNGCFWITRATEPVAKAAGSNFQEVA